MQEMSLTPLRRGATQLGESVVTVPDQNYRTRRFGYELSPLDPQQNTRDAQHYRDPLAEMLGEVGSSRNPYFHRRNSYIGGQPLAPEKENFAYNLGGGAMLPPKRENFQYSSRGVAHTPPRREGFQYSRKGSAFVPPQNENYVRTRVKNFGNAVPQDPSEHYSVPSIIDEYNFKKLNNENFEGMCKCNKTTDKVLRLIVWLLLLLIFLKMFRSD